MPKIDYHGIHRGNMGAMPAQWRRLVASKVLALNMLYWAMRSALHQHIVIAIKWPTTEVNFFVAAAFFI